MPSRPRTSWALAPEIYRSLGLTFLKPVLSHRERIADFAFRNAVNTEVAAIDRPRFTRISGVSCGGSVVLRLDVVGEDRGLKDRVVSVPVCIVQILSHIGLRAVGVVMQVHSGT